MIPHPDAPLLFLDYDGTLAPIVDDPAEAWPHPEVPGLLRALAERGPVVVVSGRDVAALTRFLPGVTVQAVGLHGAETGLLGKTPEAAPALRALAGPLAALRASVPAVDGVRVEDKGAAFAVHYRAAPDEDAAEQALLAWAANVPQGLHAVWGKKVVELRPTDISKGTAVARIAAEHPGRTPVYLGDDTTDEDAFRALERGMRDATRRDVGPLAPTETEAPTRPPLPPGEGEGMAGTISPEASATPSPDPRPPAPEASGGPVTVKVGEGDTAARYRVPDVEGAVAYLRGFTER